MSEKEKAMEKAEKTIEMMQMAMEDEWEKDYLHFYMVLPEGGFPGEVSIDAEPSNDSEPSGHPNGLHITTAEV